MAFESFEHLCEALNCTKAEKKELWDYLTFLRMKEMLALGMKYAI